MFRKSCSLILAMASQHLSFAWVGFGEMWGSENSSESAFPWVQSRRGPCGGEKGACPPVHVCSSLSDSCLWSSEHHRSKEVIWTHQARPQEQFLAQPSLVSSSGSGWTVWYLLLFLLLLQFPWKGPDLLSHAKGERKPLHLQSQECPDQRHVHIKGQG